MNRRAFGYSVLALWLGTAGTVVAHHPPLMERCQAVTFTGQIERIDWGNPHVELLVRADDGVVHTLTWLNVQQLGWAGIDNTTLRVGDRVIITAGTRDDIVDKPMLLSDIYRTSDGWEWSQLPQGC